MRRSTRSGSIGLKSLFCLPLQQDIVEENTVEMPVVTEDSSTEEDDSLEPIQQVRVYRLFYRNVFSKSFYG